MHWGSRIKATIWVSPRLGSFFVAEEGMGDLEAVAFFATGVFSAFGALGSLGVFAAFTGASFSETMTVLREAFVLGAAFAALALEAALVEGFALVSAFFLGGIKASFGNKIGTICSTFYQGLASGDMTQIG